MAGLMTVLRPGVRSPVQSTSREIMGASGGMTALVTGAASGIGHATAQRLARDDPEATHRRMEMRQLTRKMGTPAEVAAGIAFLASPKARFVNGSVFVMEAGLTTI